MTLVRRDQQETISLEDDDIDHESHFLNCLHIVATKLKADLKSTPGHQGYDNLNTEAAEQCVPTSLYLLIKWILEDNTNSIDVPSDEGPHDNMNSQMHQRILNMGQNIVYNVSFGKKNTPKHIGTGLLVHHMTRSKQLVTYLHKLSYCQQNRLINCRGPAFLIPEK